MSSMPPTEVHLQRASRLGGVLKVPGDKSISHRAAILGALADGVTEISGFVSNLDCLATLDAVACLGARVTSDGDLVRVEGTGGFASASGTVAIDARNSGTTMRLLTGVCAARPGTTTLTGDQSLSRRPMERVARPLRRMGADVVTTEGHAPVAVTGREFLAPIDHEPETPSAQVKSAVLLAGLAAKGLTRVRERVRTRDHTERMLTCFGADAGSDADGSWVAGPARLAAASVTVPGDFSSAAFLIGLGLMTDGDGIVIGGVGLNPTRTRLLDLLAGLGARIEVRCANPGASEPVGDIEVRYSEILGARDGRLLDVGPECVAEIIDEVPLLAVLGSQTVGGIRFRGAADLRAKESDRIAAVAEGLGRMGADVRATGDSLEVRGPVRLHGARIRSWGDHRIVMAFACAAMCATGTTIIENPEAAAVSFPGFFDNLPEGSVQWSHDVPC